MGQGLGRNSPVQLSLGKENYEALIDRHGQWVRWRVTNKCPCVKEHTSQPDPSCTKCHGLGVTYSFQKSKVVSQTVMVRDNTGIIEVDNDYADCPLVKVYDNSGIEYPLATKTDTFVILNSVDLPVKGVYVTIVMTETVLKTLESATCESLGGGYYRINGLRSSRTNIDGMYHTAPADIESIGTITDSNNITYTVNELRQDMFRIVPTTETIDGVVTTIPITNPVTVSNVTYVPPFTFVLLNQNLNKSDELIMQEMNGDAVLTFPYNCDVSNDDVITVLSGTFTKKNVLTRKDADYDVIPAYFVEEVITCIGNDRDFINGTDFILVGTNRIKWLCVDAPEAGETYSLTFKVFPTYKVVASIPQIRTSENQRMPKKAIVKLYDSYGESRGLNKQ